MGSRRKYLSTNFAAEAVLPLVRARPMMEERSNLQRCVLQLSEFIIKNMRTILQDWEVFARSLPHGVGMEVAQLRDHAKEILEVIAEDMAESQSKAEQRNKSLGKGRRSSRRTLQGSTPRFALTRDLTLIRCSRSIER
jgi:hypothetical protein